MTRQDDRSKASPSSATPAKAGTRLRPTRSLLALETRIVFDGAAAHAVVADGHEGAAGVMHKAIAGAAEVARTAALAPERAPVDTTAKAATPTTILFIDASVANPAALLADLKPGVEVVMLDKNSDGVQQIADALKGRHGLDSIQIISEGNDGRVLLGSATLADSNIDQYQAALASWGSALRPSGDILLFGCDVAKSATGEHFVDRMAALTGADVAASTDVTGAANLGGNWILEKHTGAIEADKAISDRAMADYDSVLVTGNGTANGDYDFGGALGAASGGFKKLNDKLLVSGFLEQAGTQLYANDANANSDGSVIVAVFKAEGTTVAKTFTFQDFSMSVTDPGGAHVRYYDQLSVVLRDSSGNVIGPTIAMSGSSLVMGTAVTKLSTLLNGGAEWSVANVASVTVTASLYANSTPGMIGGFGTEINFESMKMANISAGPVNTAPTFVGAVTNLSVPQNGGTFDVRSLLHASDSDAGQTLTWSVSSPAGHGTVGLSGGTSASGSTDITPGGTLTYTPAAGYAGTDAFTVQVTDGTATVTRTINVTVTPATPGTPDLAAGSDTGASSTDNVTNASSLTFSGTSGAGDTTSIVRAFLDVNANGVYDAGTDTTATATVSNGAWTVTGLSTTGVADGVYNVYATTTSAVGAVSSTRSTGLAVTIDKTAPGAPSTAIALRPAYDSGSSNNDRITSVTNPTVRVSLAGTNAVAGNSVELLLGGAALGTPVKNTLTTTDVINGYVDMAVIDGTLGADGNKTFTARVTDTAGNVGAAGGAMTLTLDTTAPGAPTNPILLSPTSDSGSSNSDGRTNVDTPLLRISLAGTSAVAGDKVEVLLGGASMPTPALATLTATNVSNGYLDLTVPSGNLGDGVKVLTARVIDVAGNAGAAGGSLTFTLDTTAPAAPPAPTMAAASDSGASNSDGITRITTPVFSGTAEAGSVVTLYDTNGTTVLGTATATGGVWSITSSALAAGAHSLTVKATDIAGNTSAASSALAITIDTTAPVAPAAPVLAAASDSGASNSDGITRITTPVVAGTAEAGSLVTLYDTDGTTVLGTAVATGGVWSITSSTLAQGAHSLTVKAIDTAGNTSAASNALAITIDTTAPATPVAPTLAAASDSGASNSDGITRITTPVVSGTAEAGSLVTLYDTDGSTVLGTAVATGGVWSITSSTLAAGAHSLTVKSTDTAGNTSAASSALAITIDTTAPATPVAPTLAAASDSGASNSDGITRITTPVFSGTAEAGSLVTLYDTDGTTVLGTAVASGGVWSITSSTLAAGAHSLTVKSTDTAGNTSAASSALAITVDTAAPVAPAAPVLAAASDSGASNSDGITRITTPVVAGTAEAGSLITLYDTDGTTVLGTAVATGGVWSITSSTLAAGAHSLTVKATDIAGNTSAASSALAITIDTTAPATPAAPSMAAASDSGASNSDGITRITTPVFSGTAEAGSLVTLYDTNGSTVLGTAVATGGVWSITSSTLAAGAHSLTVKATDIAGNTSAASNALAITIDTTAPVAPAAPIMAAASDSGASNSDGITRITTPVFAGTAEAGSTVLLYDTNGTTVLGSAVATGGVWSITSSTLAQGAHSLTVKAIDTAGNTSAASSALAIVIDTTAPATPAAPTLDAASDDGISNSDGITSEATPVINGTAESGSLVTLYDTDGATVLGTAVATGGAWRITSSVLADGVHNLTVKAQDAAGNTSAASSALQVTVATAPAAPAGLALAAASDSGASSTDRFTNVAMPTVTGTAPSGSIVTLYDTDGAVLGTATATGGAWSITSSLLADGSHNLTAKAVVAGNASIASGVLAVTIDTAAPGTPANPILLAPASDSGSSNMDHVTRVTTPLLRISLAGTQAVIGDTLELLLNGGSFGAPLRAVLNGTNISNGYIDLTVAAGSLGADGAKVLTARVTDVAGNVGTAGGTLTLTLDTTAPGTPSMPMLASGSDTGASNADGITRITTPTLTGTAEAGSTVTLYDTNGVTVLGTAIATGGVWTITNTTLAQGAHSLTVKAVDAAGNTSIASPALAITIDTTAPAAPGAPVLPPGSDSGASAVDGITRINTPTFTGTAEAGSLVTLYDTDGATVLGTTVATGGTWTITTSVLSEGAHALTVKATDTAGNTSAASAAAAVTIDTTAPAAPTVAGTGGIISIATPTLTGTAEAGSTITLFDTDGVTVLGTTIATGGTWTITTSVLAEGAHALTVKATDTAGNTSAASAALAITVDTMAPAAPTVASTGGATSIATPTLTGTAEAGSTVTLFDTDGVTVLGTTVATGGTWTITSSVLAEGAHALTVKATDAAGNTSAASAPLAIAIDTIAPAAPTVATRGGITATTTPTLTGTAEAGSTITLFDTDSVTVLGTTIATGGTWTITTSVLAEGAHALTVKATDAAGNTSAASATLAITIDTTAPGAPTVATTGGATSITTPTLTGTAEAGSTVTLFETDGVTVLGTTVATGGTWTITTSVLVEGAHALTVKAMDAAGNTSAASAPLAITIDTTAPAAPAVATTGGITNIATPTLTGTAEAGSTITLFDTDGVTVLGTTIAIGGTWTLTTSALAEGAHALTVKATDAAGNTSAASPALAVTIDTTAPAAPTVSTRGGISAITTPTLTGTAEAGSTITLFDTDGVTVLGTTVATGGTWTITTSVLAEGAHALTVKATDTAGNTSAVSAAVAVTIDTTAPAAPTVASQGGITSSTTPTLTGTAEAGSTVTLFDTDGVTVLGTTIATGGTWTITTSVLTEGMHALTVKATDTAGNTSAASAPLGITIDTAAPGAPTVSTTGGITNIATPTLTGTAEAGSTITLFDTDGVTVLGTTIATGGTWTITSTVLGEGAHALTVKATDKAGNTGAASAAVAITVDTTAPNAPTVAATNSITRVTTPTFSGTAEAGSTVTLFDTDGVTVLGTTVATGGAWTITSAVLADGVHRVTVRSLDAAGNTSVASPARAVTIDTTAPAAPTVASTGGIVGTRTPTVTGTAEAGSTVTLYDSNGSTVLGSTVAVNGSWTITSSALGEGSHTLTVRAVDAAGNASAASRALAVVVDTTAPLAAGTPQLPNGAASTLDTVPMLQGSAEANSTVTLRSNGTVIGTVQADATGTWRLTAQLSLGMHDITATATDAAGNTGATSPELHLTILAPPTPVITAPLPPAPVVLAEITTTVAAPPIRAAAQGQVSQSPLAAAIQAAVPQAAASFETAARLDNAYVAPAPLPTLVVNKPLGDFTVDSGMTLRFVVPADTFVSGDGSAPTLSARMVDGSPLPAWIRFDPATGTFTGTPPVGGALLEIEVVAKDANGNEVRSIFKVQTGAPQASLVGNDLLLALGMQKHAGAAATAAPADAAPGNALSEQLSHEAQRFTRAADATLRHLANI